LRTSGTTPATVDTTQDAFLFGEATRDCDRICKLRRTISDRYR
jgi:hypothetical protein